MYLSFFVEQEGGLKEDMWKKRNHHVRNIACLFIVLLVGIMIGTGMHNLDRNEQEQKEIITGLFHNGEDGSSTQADMKIHIPSIDGKQAFNSARTAVSQFLDRKSEQFQQMFDSMTGSGTTGGDEEYPDSGNGEANGWDTETDTGPADGTEQGNPKDLTGALEVHFIDVGQGDAILVTQGNSSLLIDAGNNSEEDLMVRYLAGQGISRLSMICVTHPDADHCGGMDAVADAYADAATTILMPQCTNDTVTYADMMDSIRQSNAVAEYPSARDTYTLGDAAITVLSPKKDTVGAYPDTNEYSIGLKIAYGDTAFVMCGDAPVSSEKDMVASGIDLSADVLKLGHHGSYTSSCDAFLDAVAPSCAVVSAGKGNDYGHPHEEVMKRIQDRGIKLYRTDEQGTLIAYSDGKNITWNTVPSGDYSSGDQLASDDIN